METHIYIIRDIDPFDIQTSLSAVKEAFNQLTYSHIPVTIDGSYLGCISENDAHCFDIQKNLSDYTYAIEPFFVREHTNWLDILVAFAKHSSNIMPVLSDTNTYIGYFELADVMSLFNNTPFLNENGAILVVEKGSRDYSFGEICQIVESNNSKILGVFISKIEGDKTEATLKIGDAGISSIVQTFRRYGYKIVSSHEEDKWTDKLKSHSDYLDKYLNI